MLYEFECPKCGAKVERSIYLADKDKTVVLCESDAHKKSKKKRPVMNLIISAQKIIHSSAASWRK
jgi:transcription initiation factor IIE alpha subunit